MIRYRRIPRYKYQLTARYEHQLGFDVARYFPGQSGLVATVPGFIDLYADGRLVIHTGYAWDGASGPTIDTETSKRGSLVHDALYQLIREGLLPRAAKDATDLEFRDLCIDDGMWEWRAKLWCWAVDQFGWAAL
jgi:hypothetical protein